MQDDRFFKKDIYNKNQSLSKGVNEGRVAFCLVVWNDRARKYDKRKTRHATPAPSSKYGLVEQ